MQKIEIPNKAVQLISAAADKESISARQLAELILRRSSTNQMQQAFALLRKECSGLNLCINVDDENIFLIALGAAVALQARQEQDDKTKEAIENYPTNAHFFYSEQR